MAAVCRKMVTLDSGYLNMRAGPSVKDRDIGDIPNGAVVEVMTSEGDWAFVRYNDMCGYVAARYLTDVPPEAGEKETENARDGDGICTTILREDGEMIQIKGIWRVAED